MTRQTRPPMSPKPSELRRLLAKLQANHSWLFIGFETLTVGVYYTAAPGSISGYMPWHVPVDMLDSWLPAAVWMLLGGFVIVNNLFNVVPDYNRRAALGLLALWGFYFTVMLVRDLNDPHPPTIGIATIFYGIIMLRIVVLLLFDDPHHHAKGGGA